MKKKIAIIGGGGIGSTVSAKLKEEGIEPVLISTPQRYNKSNILSNIYLDNLLESEEMQFYINHFGGKKNPTQEKYRTMPKSKLLELYEEVKNKTSNLSKRERDLVTYYATK